MAIHLALDRAAFPPLAPPAGPQTPAVRPEALGFGDQPARRAGLRQGLLLAVRFLQARLISVWGLIAAAILCPAQAFADFAIYTTLANFIALAALLRFDAIFFQNGDASRLGRAFRLALATGATFTAATAVGLALVTGAGWISGGVAALFLVSLAGRATIRLVGAEAAAQGDFATIGNSNIVQAIAQPGLMLMMIWPLGATSVALLAADALGHMVAAGYLVWRRRAALSQIVAGRCWQARELGASAVRWCNAPRFLLPSTLLSFGFMIAPLLALPLSGNPLLAAHVALGMRLLDMPSQMFQAVTVPLVMNNLRLRHGRNRQEWARLIALGLVALAGLLFAAIALVAIGLDSLLEGTQWHGAGEVIAILAVFHVGGAAVAPLHEIGSLSRHPRHQIAINAAALLAAVLLMAWFGALSHGLLGAIGLVSLLRMLAHVQFAWTRIGADPA